ncbi:MAG: hypothetical protein R2849_20800 [Thermomicrobiales bacterium]
MAKPKRLAHGRALLLTGFEDQPTTRVAVTTVGFDDVYVMLLEWTDDQRANLRIWEPACDLIWPAGALLSSVRNDRPRLAGPAVQPVRAKPRRRNREDAR